MATERASLPFTPLVAIADTEDFRVDASSQVSGDRRDGALYRYNNEIKLAINVALATGRPLLVLGPTGCGKSSLACNLARVMKRRYYEYVVTSRSQARDLFYTFDAVRRLGDCQLRAYDKSSIDDLHTVNEPLWNYLFPYIEPGPLWWILAPECARKRGYPGGPDMPFKQARDPAVWSPSECSEHGSILLIDEIDKAEPDFPNNLLVPLGSWQFAVDEIATSVCLRRDSADFDPLTHPLVIITSNRQRDLPDTFIRRCIVLVVPSPTIEQLVMVADSTFGIRKDELYMEVAKQLADIYGPEHLSTAEFLDAVQAIQRLNVSGYARADIIRKAAWRPFDQQASR